MYLDQHRGARGDTISGLSVIAVSSLSSMSEEVFDYLCVLVLKWTFHRLLSNNDNSTTVLGDRWLVV